MYSGKKILGLIPARMGSKGLPLKNIKLIAGKPLIAWTIQQAQNSKYIDDIIVSTESKYIANIAKEYNQYPVFMRPESLAQDNSSIYDVIFNVLEEYKKINKEFDYLALLEPTSPLRGKKDIDNGIKKLIDNSDIADSLISLGIVSLEHPYLIKKINSEKKIESFYDFYGGRRQDLEIVYFPYGVLYLSKVNTLISTKTFYQEKSISLLIEKWQNYEIDDEYDFICVESILKNIKGSKLSIT